MMSSVHWRPLGLFPCFIDQLPLHSLVSLLVEHRLVRILPVLRRVFWEVQVRVAPVHGRKLSQADPGPSAVCLAAFIPLLRNNLNLAVNLGKGSKSSPSKQRKIMQKALLDTEDFCKLKFWTPFLQVILPNIFTYLLNDLLLGPIRNYLLLFRPLVSIL